jgi:hypothetical protein
VAFSAGGDGGRRTACQVIKSERAAQIGKGPMMSSFYVKIGQLTSMNPKLSAAIAAVIAFSARKHKGRHGRSGVPKFSNCIFNLASDVW